MAFKKSKFSKRICEVVRKIPSGKVLTYKEVAKKAGFPRAWRGVGKVLSKNQDPKIPCHRVIRSDGKIGGYKRGINQKLTLLRKESVIIRKKKIVL